MTGDTAPELQFPLEWNGKVIACDTQEMPALIKQVLERFDLSCPVCRGNSSSGGRYVTYNLDVVLLDRGMMNDLFAALGAIPGVKVVL